MKKPQKRGHNETGEMVTQCLINFLGSLPDAPVEPNPGIALFHALYPGRFG